MGLENKKVLSVGCSHGMVIGTAPSYLKARAEVFIAGRDLHQLRLTGQVLEISGGTHIKV